MTCTFISNISLKFRNFTEISTPIFKMLKLQITSHSGHWEKRLRRFLRIFTRKSPLWGPIFMIPSVQLLLLSRFWCFQHLSYVCFWVSQWLSQNDYLRCTVQNSHCHISASGGTFLSFKVVHSCFLICSDISDGLYVSIMSHCDVTPIFVNWCIQKHRLGLTSHFRVMTQFLWFEVHNSLY